MKLRRTKKTVPFSGHPVYGQVRYYVSLFSVAVPVQSIALLTQITSADDNAVFWLTDDIESNRAIIIGLGRRGTSCTNNFACIVRPMNALQHCRLQFSHK